MKKIFFAFLFLACAALQAANETFVCDTAVYIIDNAAPHAYLQHDFHLVNKSSKALLITKLERDYKTTEAWYAYTAIEPGQMITIRTHVDVKNRTGQFDEVFLLHDNAGGEIRLLFRVKVVTPDPATAAAVMQFQQKEMNSGEVYQGTVIRQTFQFTNTGNAPLIIRDIRTSDGGGGNKYYGPDTVYPGRSGRIELFHNTAGRIGVLDKVTTVESNNRDGNIMLHLKATVLSCAGMAEISFKEDTIRFDTIEQGTTVHGEYHFTNTGKEPLIIQSAHTSTGAAVADYPKEPIPPGRSAVIKLTFSTSGKMGPQSKTVVVQSNACVGTTVLRYTAYVRARVEDPLPPANVAPLRGN